MNADEQHIAELEAELQAERAALSENLETLRDRLRPASLVRSAGKTIKNKVFPPREPVAPPLSPTTPPIARPAAPTSRATVVTPLDRPAVARADIPNDRLPPLRAQVRAAAADASSSGWADTALDVVRQHPLLGAAVAATVGAVLGARLPIHPRETGVLNTARNFAAVEARQIMMNEALTVALAFADTLLKPQPPAQGSAQQPAGVQRQATATRAA